MAGPPLGTCRAAQRPRTQPLLDSSEERARFEAHLVECDGCAGWFDDFRGVVVTLHEAPERPPDPATREALLRAFRDLRAPP